MRGPRLEHDDEGGFTRFCDCRFCGYGHPCVEVINFGLTPLGNNYLKQDSTQADFENERRYPLTLMFCPECAALQISAVPDAQLSVWKDYMYLSSAILFARDHFLEYAAEFPSYFVSKPEDVTVLEFGCNDGVFLRPLAARGFKVIGVDPATKIVQDLIAQGFTVYDDFFGEESVGRIVAEHGRVDAVVTSNSFAHISDMHDVMLGVVNVLKPEGFLAIQVHYAVAMVEKMQYDWIYHEHMSYYTLHSLRHFLRHFNFEIFDAKLMSVHGGSLRIFAQLPQGGRPVTDAVCKIIASEQELGVTRSEFYTNFEQKMAESREQIRKPSLLPEVWSLVATLTHAHSSLLTQVLSDARGAGKTVLAYGAPARATTLSSYIGLDFMASHVTAVIDDSPTKQGALMPGTHLPIISSDVLRAGHPTIPVPDIVILFAWSWAHEIVPKNRDFLLKGGAFVVPLPTVTVLDAGTVVDPPRAT